MPELPPKIPPSLSPEQERGRVFLLIAFALMVLLDLLVIGLQWTALTPLAMVCSGIRVCLTLALMYAIWIGQRWARWLLVGLAYAASLFMFFVLLLNQHPLSLAMLVVFGFGATLLAFSKDVGSFLRFQRMKRRKPAH